MKTRSLILMSWFAFALMSCSTYSNLDIDLSHTVTVDSDTSVVNAQILLESKEVKTQDDKVYFSFRKDKIYHTRGAINGVPLHGKYEEFYPTGELKQLGYFKNGLKESVWKTWFSNGEISSLYNFKNGEKHGEYFRYSITGKVTAQGKFCRGTKVGKHLDCGGDSCVVVKYSFVNGNLK